MPLSESYQAFVGWSPAQPPVRHASASAQTQGAVSVSVSVPVCAPRMRFLRTSAKVRCAPGSTARQQMMQPFSLVWLPPTAFSLMYIKSLCTLGLRAKGATTPYAFPSLHFLVLKDLLWSS